MAYTWVPPESKLDAEQRAALTLIKQNKKKNFWIQGFAGSGKTILLIHAMREIKRANPSANVAFVVYTRALMNLIESGLGREFKGVPVVTFPAFDKNPQQFDVILVDEVQDLPEGTLEQLKDFAGRLIVAGDNAQSIYTERVTPEQIKSILEPLTVIELSIIHRITRKIYELAEHFGRIIPPKDQIELDVSVPLWNCPDVLTEAGFCFRHLNEVAMKGIPAAVLLPNNDEVIGFANRVLQVYGAPHWEQEMNRFKRPDFDSLNSHLEDNDVALQYLGGMYGDLVDPGDGLVRLMTYFSAKGLDFNTVFLPRLSRNLEIWRNDNGLARRLFFVALTRCRQNLHLSFSGKAPAHPFVEEIRNLMEEMECEGAQAAGIGPNSIREPEDDGDMPF